MRILGSVEESILLLEFYQAWKSASRQFRGKIVADAMAAYGLSEPSIRKRFQLLDSNKDLFEVCGQVRAKQKRLAPEVEAKILSDIHTIAAIMFGEANGGKFLNIPSVRAAERAFRIGLVDRLYPKSTVDHWLRKLGLNRKAFLAKGNTASWHFEYSNQMHMWDGTVGQSHFIGASNRIETIDVHPYDKKLPEALAKKNLRKLILLVNVDCYSGSFYAKGYASEPIGENAKTGGESAALYREFLADAWMGKNDLAFPMQGLPDYGYSDKHSSFKSLESFFLNLGIDFANHFPGNPAAKGRVEARIFAIQRNIETMLNKRNVPTIDEFNDMLYRWTRHYNQINGYSEKFIEGARKKPIRSCTLKNIQDASVKYFKRKVDTYHLVSIHKKEYFVSNEIIEGTYVQISHDPKKPSKYIAKTPDGFVCELDPKGRRHQSPGSYSKFTLDEDGVKESAEWSQPQYKKRQAAVIQQSEGIRNITTLEDIAPDETNLIYFPPVATRTETHSMVASEFYTNAADAFLFICTETKTNRDNFDSEILDHIEKQIQFILRTKSKIERSEIYQLVNIIQTFIRKNEEVVNGN